MNQKKFHCIARPAVDQFAESLQFEFTKSGQKSNVEPVRDDE